MSDHRDNTATPTELPPEEHLCHAMGCRTPVAPRLFMCRTHWRMIPREIRREIWRCYRPGQEVDKKPSREYLMWTARATVAVAREEGYLDEQAAGRVLATLLAALDYLTEERLPKRDGRDV